MIDYPHRMFLKFDSGIFQIPVPPQNIAGGTQSKVSLFDIVGYGEVMTVGGITLDRVNWESHFPFDYDDSIEVVSESEHIPPEQWLKLIADTQINERTVQLTIANTLIDMQVAIIDFKYSYIPGPQGDIWYQIQTAEFKEGVIREFNGVDFPSVDVRARPFGPLPTTYTVRAGQTLVDVSLAVYGTTRNYTDLYKANLSQIFATAGSSSEQQMALGSLDLSTSNPDFWNLWKKDDPLPTGIVLRVPNPT